MLVSILKQDLLNFWKIFELFPSYNMSGIQEKSYIYLYKSEIAFLTLLINVY